MCFLLSDSAHKVGDEAITGVRLLTGFSGLLLLRFAPFAPLKGSVFFEVFTGFPAGTVKIRWHEQLQQKISSLSILVASQMAITSYHFGRFKVP